MDFLRLLEEIRNPAATALFKVFTLLAEEAVIIGTICLLYWCLDKALAYKTCFAYFISGLVVQALKITFRVPRPWIKDPSFQPVGEAIETATGYSFPSGHTQSATALYGTLGTNTKRKAWRIFCFVSIAGVAFSRMYLGVHTPQDVLVSFSVSTLLIWGMNMVMHKAGEKLNMEVTALLLMGAAIAVMAYSILLLKNGTIELKYASDCCKAGGAGIGFSIGWYIERKYINFQERACSNIMQVIKYVIGIGVALGLKAGLKVVLGSTIPMDIIRYIIVILWITAIYPVFIKKFFTKAA
ncbi:MAG: phosphatase PAP2 family protein [Lachnospiraceae bacterium]|nr:phosphatase PAP2 family protein [Lachnospiraceae bacterium]